MAILDKNSNPLAVNLSVSPKAKNGGFGVSVNIKLTPYTLKNENELAILNTEKAVPVLYLDVLESNDEAALTALGKIEAALQEFVTAKEI